MPDCTADRKTRSSLMFFWGLIPKPRRGFAFDPAKGRRPLETCQRAVPFGIPQPWAILLGEPGAGC